jgi:hypothetical protein
LTTLSPAKYESHFPKEPMGDHVNTKKDTTKHHKRGFAESQDVRLQRARRVSFKRYVEQLEEELLDEELNNSDSDDSVQE